jgi:predicted DNA-binding transcriptional regulator AlpA
MPTQHDIVNNSDWLTVREAMQYARISRSRLYNMIADAVIRDLLHETERKRKREEICK